MKKIVRLHAFGGPEHLKIDVLPSPSLQAGEVRLKVEALGINRDHYTFMRGEQFKGHGFVQPTLPSRLGYEVAGEVIEVGKGVNAAWVGKKVAPFFGFDESKYGVIGEEAIIPATFLSEYPSNLSPAQAAAFWVPYLTAYGGLVAIAKVKKGDFVSILAGSSSVGQAAIQLAHDAGAKAIAVTRSAAKKQILLDFGADHVIVTNDEDYVACIQEITAGKGVRITFDPIGGPFLEQLAVAAALNGVIIEYGRLSGQPAPFPLMPVVGKGLSLRGYTVSEVVRDAKILAKAKKYLLTGFAEGRFVPKVAKTFPLEQIVEAYRYVESNEQIGRVIVVP